MQRAIEIYTEEQTNTNPHGLNKIRAQVKSECLKTSRKVVKITKSSMHQCIHGSRSHMDASEDRRWLNDVETEAVLKDII